MQETERDDARGNDDEPVETDDELLVEAYRFDTLE